MYEVIIIWDDCKKDVEYVVTKEQANRIYEGAGNFNTLFRNYHEVTKDEIDGIYDGIYVTQEYKEAVEIGLDAFSKMFTEYSESDLDVAEWLYDELGYSYDDIKNYKDKSVLDWFVRAIDYDDLWARYLVDKGLYDDVVKEMDPELKQKVLSDIGDNYTVEEFFMEYMDKHYYKYGKEFDVFK